MRRELRDLWEDFTDEIGALCTAGGLLLGLLALVGILAR